MKTEISIGVIQSNTDIPFPLGSVGNRDSFSFDVQYCLVESLTAKRLIVEADPTLESSIIKAAKELERAGVSAIMGDCGHMIQFQLVVKESVQVPVFLSSWLQLPFIHSILPSNKKIGVLMANGQFFRRQFLTHAGIDQTIVLHIIGMQDHPAFKQAYIDEPGGLDFQAVKSEMITAAETLIDSQPDIGVLLLECSDMPPFASAIKQAFNIPVFDYLTMANFIYSSLTR